MKILSLILFVLFMNNLFGQIPEYFEFLDQDYHTTNVTGVYYKNKSIIYTANSGDTYKDGGTRITIIDSIGKNTTVELNEPYHNRSNFYELPNGKLLVQLFGLFDCDYYPGGSIFGFINDTSFQQIELSIENEFFTNLDGCITMSENVPVLNILNTDSDNSYIMHFDLEGRYLGYDPVNINAKRVFSHNNEIVYITDIGEIINFKTDEILLHSVGKIKSIKQISNELIIIADQIIVYDLNTNQVIQFFEYDSKIILPDSTFFSLSSTLTKVNDVIYFLASDDVGEHKIYSISDSNPNGKIAYIEPYSNLKYRTILHMDSMFITTLGLGEVGIVRRSKHLQEYNYERVNIGLSNAHFFGQKIDTFEINTEGDTSFLKVDFMTGTVDISNLGNNPIYKTTLKSHIFDRFWYDCGEAFIKQTLNDSIPSNTTINFQFNHKYKPDIIGETFFYCPGADYKLDYDLSDNFIYGPLTTHLHKTIKSSVDIYPNPTAGIINIISDSEETSIIKIINTQGQIVKMQEFHLLNNSELDVNDLQKGCYWVQLINGTSSITKKIIKI